MSTVGALIDRLYRSILEPPDLQPHMGFLASSIDTSASQLVLSGFTLPEDEQFLQLGRLIEVDSELMRIESYSSNTKTITLNTVGGRNKENTVLASHDAGAVVKIGAPWSRQSVFEAVRDNIVALYPKLYTVNTAFVSHAGAGSYPLDDPLAVEVIRATPEWSSQSIHGRIVDFSPSTGGRAFISSVNAGNVWLTYRRRFGVADTEDDTFTNLGIESVWSWLICIGAAADLLVGRDVPQQQQNMIGRQIEYETKPPGTESSIALRLRQYYSYLIEGFQAEMNSEYRPRVAMRSPFYDVTGGVQ